ncbi:MAG: NUDIX hydrolase [Candidatus Limnocylindrales bacterium]
MVRQEIPRPPWARRIHLPVDGLEVADPSVELTMGAVRGAFAAGTVPDTRPLPVAPGEAGAAVLIALVPFDERGSESAVSVVLIRRAVHLRANPGEIAFPGGRIEPGETPLAAALREAEEEIGLRADVLDVLGGLASLGRPRRSAPILPFVAAARGRPALEANPDEVDCVLMVPLAELVAPERYWQEEWGRPDHPAWAMHFFDLGEDVVWGATAHMLHALFLRLLGRCVSPSAAPRGWI